MNMPPERPIEDGQIRFKAVLSVIITIIGCSATLLTGAVVGTWWIGTKLNVINTGIADGVTAQHSLGSAIEEVRANSYTLSRASEVALRQAIATPGVPVVDPRDPSRTIMVKEGTHSDSGSAIR